MPQVSGQLRFARELRDKISRGVRDFKGLNHPVCYSDRAKEVVERYKVSHTFTLSVMILLFAQELVCLITSYEEKLFDDWTQSAENLTTENLERPLLVRDDLEGTLSVNFGHNLMSSLMEVKNLKKEFQTRQVPKAVAEVFKRFDEYRKNKNSLDQTVRMYNYLKLNTVREEYSLIEVDIETCDDRLRAAENQVNWNTRNIKDYLEELRLMTYKLESRVVSAQENVKKIKREINKWVDKPLFIRINDSKKEPLLNIGSREEMKSKRYKDIEKTSAIIQELIEENEFQCLE